MSFSDCSSVVSDIIEIIDKNGDVPSRTSANAQKEVSGTAFSEPLISL